MKKIFLVIKIFIALVIALAVLAVVVIECKEAWDSYWENVSIVQENTGPQGSDLAKMCQGVLPLVNANISYVSEVTKQEGLRITFDNATQLAEKKYMGMNLTSSLQVSFKNFCMDVYIDNLKPADFDKLASLESKDCGVLFQNFKLRIFFTKDGKNDVIEIKSEKAQARFDERRTAIYIADNIEISTPDGTRTLRTSKLSYDVLRRNITIETPSISNSINTNVTVENMRSYVKR